MMNDQGVGAKHMDRHAIIAHTDTVSPNLIKFKYFFYF